ncbi:hypothetical protein E1212_07585 [Jiangella ureilytica]|uniref:Uncharacterized protein n=1 Tax=Jiangella ureilytica TaxID=2530374 RepID=A0A4R4RWL0_9ACTN|nr:hypothetical protein [Jiangella ureilytica]TDC52993.1 hypothetical protein E1212_07585 [Jiangella ureilytica]
MSDPVAELNQLLYTATPSERRAVLRAALPVLARWMVDSVDTCAGDEDPDTSRWPLLVSTELLVPLGAAVHRAQTATSPVPRQAQGRQAPTTTS